LHQFWIKFLVLLSTVISVNAAVATPLSAAFNSSIQALSLAKQLSEPTLAAKANELTNKLTVSLLTLLQQKHSSCVINRLLNYLSITDNLFHKKNNLLINNRFSALTQQKYQDQKVVYFHSQAISNCTYIAKPSYQSKKQAQQQIS
jgi:hypothetical protein